MGEQIPNIELMPLTQIKAIEWEKIGEIMNYMLSNNLSDDDTDIWSIYFTLF